jgi:chromosome segregation ATPase
VSEAEEDIEANTTSLQNAHALIAQAQEDIETNEENINKNLSSINALNADMQHAEEDINNHQTLIENNTASINQVNTKADTAQNTANQALNKFNQYLPLGGGTMSGGIQFTSGGPTIQYNSSNKALTIAFL